VTAPIGYKLASRILAKEKALIAELAVVLTEMGSLDEKSLLAWFQENAPPYSLDELEKANTYQDLAASGKLALFSKADGETSSYALTA